MSSFFLFITAFVASPEDVTVCDAQSLPQVFNFSCSFISIVLPNWFVTGLSGVQDQVLIFRDTIGSLSYATFVSMDSASGVATLIVDRSAGMEVIVGTCFSCRFSTIPPTDSDRACVKETGELF